MSQPIRAFGDPTEIRSKLRRVIRRGQAIRDEIEGGRQSTRPDDDSEAAGLFANTAVYRGRKAVRRWSDSIDDLVGRHVPSLQETFNRVPIPEAKKGLQSLELLDALDRHVQMTIDELEALRDSITNEPPSETGPNT